MDKLCCDCSHMDDFSEWESDYLACRKGHFSGIAFVRLVRENIRRAETCEDYTTESVPRPPMTACGLPSVGWLQRTAPDYSAYNAPFCRTPLECGPKGYCLNQDRFDRACND